MNILLCGESSFVEDQQNKISEVGHTVVAIATSVARAADFFKSIGYDAVLLGFDTEDSIALLENIRPPEGVKVWVSVQNVTLPVWNKMAVLNAIPVLRGSESKILKSIGQNGTQKEKEDNEPDDFKELRKKDFAVRMERVETKTAKVGVLKHRIYSIYSPKGGAGKTTVGTYLAYTIAKHTNLKVCIVDLDHTREGSDVARKFGYFLVSGQVPNNVITNFAKFPEREYSSWAKVSEYLAETDITNLYFLASPWNIEDEKLLTNELIDKVTYILKQHMDIIIFDMSDDIRVNNKRALELSDSVLFVSGADVDSIDIASGFVQRTMNKLNLPVEKLRLIFNQVPSKIPYTLQEAAQKIGIPLFGEIPEDVELRKLRTEAIGVSDIISSRTPFGFAVYRLAQDILPPGSIASSQLKVPWYKKLLKRGGNLA
ncbi:MAG: CpaE family protein [Tepidibacillus sp.]